MHKLLYVTELQMKHLSIYRTPFYNIKCFRAYFLNLSFGILTEFFRYRPTVEQRGHLREPLDNWGPGKWPRSRPAAPRPPLRCNINFICNFHRYKSLNSFSQNSYRKIHYCPLRSANQIKPVGLWVYKLTSILSKRNTD